MREYQILIAVSGYYRKIQTQVSSINWEIAPRM